MAEQKTNIELITHLMEFSKHGAVMQLFIMEALNKYALAVAQTDPELLSNPLINGSQWQGAAVEFLEALNTYQNRGIEIPQYPVKEASHAQQ